MSNSEEFQKATNGYQTAISLWKLASEQIYSRFGAMLTANSIIIAIAGLIVTSKINFPKPLVLSFIGLGIFLCLLWFCFIRLGVKAENHYRNVAEKIESKCIPDGYKIVIPTSDKRFRGFGSISYITIGIFVLLYICLIIFYCSGK